MTSHATSHALSRLKILVADDNALLRRGFQDMLSLWGVARVLTAADGLEAKALLGRESIDLLVTDWGMAPVDGGALLRWVRHSAESPRHDLPVIVLTGQADVATVRTAWDAGADAVLAKPVSAVTITRRIETVLRRPRRLGRPAEAAARTGGAEPPGEALFPSLGAETRHADGARGLPGPGTAPPGYDRLRVMVSLDRLEAILDKDDVNLGALRVVVADLQHATAGDATMEAVARSLARCVTRVDPFVPAFLDTLRAHQAGLRWLATRTQDSPAADRSLVACLSANVDSLIERHPLMDATLRNDEPAARRPRAPHLPPEI